MYKRRLRRGQAAERMNEKKKLTDNGLFSGEV